MARLRFGRNNSLCGYVVGIVYRPGSGAFRIVPMGLNHGPRCQSKRWKASFDGGMCSRAVVSLH